MTGTIWIEEQGLLAMPRGPGRVHPVDLAAGLLASVLPAQAASGDQVLKQHCGEPEQQGEVAPEDGRPWSALERAHRGSNPILRRSPLEDRPGPDHAGFTARAGMASGAAQATDRHGLSGIRGQEGPS